MSREFLMVFDYILFICISIAHALSGLAIFRDSTLLEGINDSGHACRRMSIQSLPLSVLTAQTLSLQLSVSRLACYQYVVIHGMVHSPGTRRETVNAGYGDVIRRASCAHLFSTRCVFAFTVIRASHHPCIWIILVVVTPVCNIIPTFL